MRIPLWIGCPAVIALSVVDAALEIQTRAVGALTRGLIGRMGILIPAQSYESTAPIAQSLGSRHSPVEER